MTKLQPITEAQWQHQVIELAAILGYKANHTRRSIGKGGRWVTATSIVGWPDLVLYSPSKQRTIYVELKSDKGRLTAEQTQVLDDLRKSGNEVAVWRPSDLETVHEYLKGPAPEVAQ